MSRISREDHRAFSSLLLAILSASPICCQAPPAPPSIPIADYVAAWRAADPQAFLVEMTNRSGFAAASDLSRTLLWERFVKSPEDVNAISRQVFDIKNPLGVNQSKDGLCWWQLPKPLVLAFFNRGDAVQGIVAGSNKELTLDQRMALMGRWVVLPLVADRTVRVVRDSSGFRLDKAQWKGNTDDPPVKDQRPIFTGIGYHPLMWVDDVDSQKPGRKLVRMNNLKYRQCKLLD